MKYIVRALKYFLNICILLVLILWILSLLHFVDADVNSMFKNGWQSVLLIAGMFLLVAAIYPKFGYTNRATVIPGEYSQIRDGIISYMKEHGYELEKEEGENLSFRQQKFLSRASRSWEDRITMTRELPGYYIEGLSRDVTRIVYGLEARFNNHSTTDPDEQ